MTEKQLKRLRRADLLEMLLALVKENDELRLQLDTVQKQLDDRMLKIEPVGSLAEAALALNGVFESAQAACEQYIDNVIGRSRNIEEYCNSLEEQTRIKCEQMLEEARLKAQSYGSFDEQDDGDTLDTTDEE